jgi:hypothetical protein
MTLSTATASQACFAFLAFLFTLPISIGSGKARNENILAGFYFAPIITILFLHAFYYSIYRSLHFFPQFISILSQ